MAGRDDQFGQHLAQGLAAKGIADVAYINVGYQPGRMLVANAIQLPFLVTNADGGSRAFDEWYRGYAAKDMPGVRMCLMYIHDPGSLHSKVKITSPEQLKGMKVRPAHAVMADWMKSLGATTVSLSAPESREALERGVADAITFPWESIYLFGIDMTKSDKRHPAVFGFNANRLVPRDIGFFKPDPLG